MVEILSETFVRVTMPILILIGLGYGLQKWRSLDVETLMTVFLNLVLPCALVHYLSSANLPLSAVAFTALFVIVQFFAFLLIGIVFAWLLRIDHELRWVFALAVAYPNSANFGIPVIELAFGPDWILHQSVISAVQAVLVIAAVAVLLGEHQPERRSLRSFRPRGPLIPAIAVGLVIKGFEVQLPLFISEPLRITAGAFTPLALIILGVTVATSKLSAWKPVASLIGFRLFVAPALTALWLVPFAVSAPLDDVLVVGAASPVGVLLAMFVAQTKREQPTAFVSSAIVATTLISPIAIALVITILEVTVYAR